MHSIMNIDTNIVASAAAELYNMMYYDIAMISESLLQHFKITRYRT